ncbi:MAG: hypothetical protein IT374_08710 [Polyangiaceae bacterium]|nr:hypothetical protein [Polyangiaceae bacterium]
MRAALYDALGAVLGHPGPGYSDDIARAIALCEDGYPEAAAALREFSRLLPEGDPLALAELHTRTFDVQPVTSLDVGYTLFGEDYKRGALLANLSREHADAGNDCGLELADHLTNVLRLLPRMADAAIRQELVAVLVEPAVREMVREFEPPNLVKKEELYRKHLKTVLATAPGEQRLAYRHALLAVKIVLQRDFSLRAPLPVVTESKFTSAVGAELGIEA